MRFPRSHLIGTRTYGVTVQRTITLLCSALSSFGSPKFLDELLSHISWVLIAMGCVVISRWDKQATVQSCVATRYCSNADPSILSYVGAARWLRSLRS